MRACWQIAAGSQLPSASLVSHKLRLKITKPRYRDLPADRGGKKKYGPRSELTLATDAEKCIGSPAEIRVLSI